MSDLLDFIPLLEKQMLRVDRGKTFIIKDLEQVFRLFSLFFERITDNEAIAFTTLFSRLAFIGVKYDLPGKLLFENHIFRKKMEKRELSDADIEKSCKWGLYLIYATALQVSDYEWQQAFTRPDIQLPGRKTTGRRSFSRIFKALLIEITEEGVLKLIDENKADVVFSCSLDKTVFEKQVMSIRKHLELPVNINLVDVSFFQDEKCEAKGLVLRPDLLLGVTSISECFSSHGTTSIKYLGRKLIPTEGSVHMLIGNIVNHYLDELIHNPELEFDEVKQATFKIGPEMFTLMTDEQVITTISKVKNHFNNLKRVVNSELAEAGITKDQTYLEPSFYSNEFGLQGRLDLYHLDEEQEKSDIVELKSGKVYQAHTYGLNQNHYVQTLLYDLLIESVYNNKIRSTSYILYSGDDKKRLRFAAKVRSKQMEAMKLRNNLILLEELMTKIDQPSEIDFLASLNPEKISEQHRFLRRDAKAFWEVYEKLETVERLYYKSFLAFISREFQLSKIGRHGIYRSNGLAALWLDPMMEKLDRFSILAYLKIIENRADEDVPVIVLGFSMKSNKLSKFRKGDIVILYPAVEEEDAALSSQIFKCTILELDAERVSIRLRARQKNFDLFRQYDYWHLESDSLDSGFNHQLHGLFDFMEADRKFRARILTISPPALPTRHIVYKNSALTEEQQAVMGDIINAEDYFLLWGPPGTGKTSIMLKNLVDYYYNETEHDILLLAYTNRAVDEICAAIHDLLDGNYLRIGSRYSTAPRYKNQLLSYRTDNIKTRAELAKLFSETRIFVSTISSFQGKRELRKLKNFEVAIVDEASQLLEPMLAGLMSRFGKFVLIGDHKQLPAVVAQSERQSKVEQKALTALGLKDRRVSLFERMYRRAREQEWTWAYGALTYQGRMHQQIMEFISPEFYENRLQVLPGLKRLVAEPSWVGETLLQKFLSEHRMIFIDTPIDPTLTRKTNAIEAELVAELAAAWLLIYQANEIPVTESAIGVITPFRSQIAIIKSQEFFRNEEAITIDTVERYQGGARNQIIISLAINEANLLDSITNISEEGIDRKLNVALTRAKEHLIIIGNRDILKRSQTYERLIENCMVINADEIVRMR